jgi:hypothetical protein
MGCWNGTCGITQLPILSGEKVRLILIARVMQSDCLYYPVTIPIPGTYDDYGGVMFGDDDPVVKTCLDRIKNFVTPTDQGDLQGLLRKEDDTAPYITDLMTREKVRPGIFMIREGVYQALVDAFYSPDLDWDRYYPKPDYREEARKLANQIVEWSREAASEIVPLSDVRLRLISVLHPFSEEGLNKLVQAWGFLPVMVRHGVGALERSLSELALKRDVTEEDLLPVLYAIADVIVLNHMLGMLRIGLVPQAGAGSQSIATNMHRHLARTILKEIDVIDHFYDEDE